MLTERARPVVGRADDLAVRPSAYPLRALGRGRCRRNSVRDRAAGCVAVGGPVRPAGLLAPRAKPDVAGTVRSACGGAVQPHASRRLRIVAHRGTSAHAAPIATSRPRSRDRARVGELLAGRGHIDPLATCSGPTRLLRLGRGVVSAAMARTTAWDDRRASRSERPTVLHCPAEAGGFGSPDHRLGPRPQRAASAPPRDAPFRGGGRRALNAPPDAYTVGASRSRRSACRRRTHRRRRAG
jgi:hypothetical protein